jgi:hypothetical protein
MSGGADSYDLQRQLNSGSWTTILSAVPASNGIGAVNHTEDATANATYAWRVKAHNSSGDTYSNTATYVANSTNCGSPTPPPDPNPSTCQDTNASNYGGALPCQYASNPTLTDNGTAAAVSGYTIPDTLTPGQVVPFRVRVANTGNTRWYDGGTIGNNPPATQKGYRFVRTDGSSAFSIVSVSPSPAGLNYGHLPYEMDPPDSYDWVYNLTAPSTPGQYTITMQMLHGAGYVTRSSTDGTIGDPICCDSYFGGIFSKTFTVATPVPTVSSVTISPNPVTADGSTAHTVTIVASNPGGGSGIDQVYVLSNLAGTNAGQYRGYLSWAPTDVWPTNKGDRSCTGGGYAAIQSVSPNDVYGHQYIELTGCSTSVSGNNRTVTFTVKFNTNFTAPIANNLLSGNIRAGGGNFSGWISGQTYSLVGAPPAGVTLTISANPSPKGYVASFPGSISCGTSNGTNYNTCSATFAVGSTTVLTATPASAYWRFTGWDTGVSGECPGTGSCTLNITTSRAVTASFAPRAFNYNEF